MSLWLILVRYCETTPVLGTPRRVKAQGLPASAAKPGGGTSVKGLSSDWLAKQVLQVIRRRQPDRVFPGWLRLLIALGHLKPSLGDWLLLRKTTSKD